MQKLKFKRILIIILYIISSYINYCYVVISYLLKI